MDKSNKEKNQEALDRLVAYLRAEAEPASKTGNGNGHAVEGNGNGHHTITAGTQQNVSSQSH